MAQLPECVRSGLLPGPKEVGMPLLADLNIVYGLVLLAVWTSTLAIYIPGTGLVELAGLALSVVALTGLSGLPTNWLALIVIVVGAFIFLLTPLYRRRHLPLAVAGLLAHVVASLLLFNGSSVSWVLIALNALISLAAYQYVPVPTVATRENKPIMNDEAAAGAGRVVAPIDRWGLSTSPGFGRRAVNIR
jgi:membrane-bound ClpP family serine protease